MAEPPDLGDPSSYLVLADGTPVYASGGEEVGKVEHVLAEPDLDLFDGIVVEDPRVADGHLFVDASQVDECFERGVLLGAVPSPARFLAQALSLGGVGVSLLAVVGGLAAESGALSPAGLDAPLDTDGEEDENDDGDDDDDDR